MAAEGAGENRHLLQDMLELIRIARVRAPQLPIFALGEQVTIENAPAEAMADLDPLRGILYLFEDTVPFLARQVARAVRNYLDGLLPPFFRALVQHTAQSNYSWHTPGHSGGVAYRKSPVGQAFHQFFGENTLHSDLSVSVPGEPFDHRLPGVRAHLRPQLSGVRCGCAWLAAPCGSRWLQLYGRLHQALRAAFFRRWSRRAGEMARLKGLGSSAVCSVAAVLAATGAGLVDADAGQLWKEGLELLPDPLGDDLAGRVLQAWNLVQVVVVELLVKWLEDRFDFGKIANPAGVRVDLAFDVDGHSKGVAMQPATFVPGGHMGEPVGRLENKLFEQFHKMSL